jgi:hypothetical protein
VSVPPVSGVRYGPLFVKRKRTALIYPNSIVLMANIQHVVCDHSATRRHVNIRSEESAFKYTPQGNGF